MLFFSKQLLITIYKSFIRPYLDQEGIRGIIGISKEKYQELGF